MQILKMSLFNPVKKHFELTKRSCWRMIERHYPEVGFDKYSITDFVLLEKVKSNYLVVEAGCGHSSSKFYERNKQHRHFKVIGVDILLSDIIANCQINLGVVSDIEHMPFKDASIDIVVTRMVIEHLKRPQIFFNEVSRVLKPTGAFLLMTPCKFGLVTSVSRLLPEKLRPWLAKNIIGTPSTDVFPTYYRANTLRALDRYLREASLYRDKVVNYQPPPYAFVFSRIACGIAIVYFRLIAKYETLSFLRDVIIARYVKNRPI